MDTLSSETDKAELRRQIERLNMQLQSLEFKNDKERKLEIMELLHKYNYLKDATQILIGKIAISKGVTCKKVHQLLNLPLN